MQGTGQQIRAGPSNLCWLRSRIHHMAHVLAKFTPGTANSAPIYDILGFGIVWAGPGSCRAPRAFVENPRARFLLSGVQLGYPWDWHTLDSRVGFWPQQSIFIAGRLIPGPQVKFLSTTQPELGMQSPAPGADSHLGLLINFLEPLAYFLDPLANIPEPSPRQPHRLFARML